MALAHLHWDMPVGSTLTLGLDRGDHEEGRVDRLRDVVVGAGFAVQDVTVEDRSIRARASRQRTLPDTVGPGMRLLVCGLNPSLYAADAGVGFARPGNRFWPAALGAGIVTTDRDARAALLEHRIGMTDLVKRATVRAEELSRDE